MSAKRRFLVPEIIQTSNLDCGPAALKCLLEGFGRHVSYGRLREACQTGIDGTSIDSIEAVANRLGLVAEQVMLPVDDVFLPEARALPALIVVTLPIGLTHFVVVWRRHGTFLQVMDPASGRRWVTISEFKREIYRHTIAVAAEDWREFAATGDFQAILRARLQAVGVERAEIDGLIRKALEDPGWRGIAALDAAARFAEAQRICSFDRIEETPAEYWQAEEGAGSLLLRGAVLLRVRGLEPADAKTLSPELAAALSERPASAGRELLAAVGSKALIASIAAAACAVAAGMIGVEATLVRELWGSTSAYKQLVITCVLVLIVLIELPALAGALRLGRKGEIAFREALLGKLPKIADRYFHSRLMSDMAERSHLVPRLRNLAPLSYRILRTSFEVLATAAAVMWLDPGGALAVAAIVAAAFVPLLVALPALNERDLRLRTHTGALTRFYLDAMLGLTAIRAQRGEGSIRYEHAMLLAEWKTAARRFHFAAALTETIQLAAAFALVARFVFVAGNFGAAEFMLIGYWVLNVPALAEEFGALVRQCPYHRNVALRLLEPLGAPEERRSESPLLPAECLPHEISFRGVSVEVSGHRILEGIDLTFEPGEHVAIVGASGAGKSSLAGVLLGWYEPCAGEVLVDGQPLDVQDLRRHSAWVDPAVQLWNRSLRTNLAYGSEPDEEAIDVVVERARLRAVVEKLPIALESSLGEGGGLVSGGEGQRMRFARALLRDHVRLAILDEPFRGLDREQRRELLACARDAWRRCTLLCITHDIEETQSFDRVIVVEAGRIMEQGFPAELRARPESRYAQMLAAEAQARQIWEAGFWRRIRVDESCLEEAGVETA